MNETASAPTCETKSRDIRCGMPAAFIVEGPYTTRHLTCRLCAHTWLYSGIYPRCVLIPILWASYAERVENGDCEEPTS